MVVQAAVQKLRGKRGFFHAGIQWGCGEYSGAVRKGCCCEKPNSYCSVNITNGCGNHGGKHPSSARHTLTRETESSSSRAFSDRWPAVAGGGSVWPTLSWVIRTGGVDAGSKDRKVARRPAERVCWLYQSVQGQWLRLTLREPSYGSTSHYAKPPSI